MGVNCTGKDSRLAMGSADFRGHAFLKGRATPLNPPGFLNKGLDLRLPELAQPQAHLAQPSLSRHALTSPATPSPRPPRSQSLTCYADWYCEMSWRTRLATRRACHQYDSPMKTSAIPKHKHRIINGRYLKGCTSAGETVLQCHAESKNGSTMPTGREPQRVSTNACTSIVQRSVFRK